MTGLRKRVALCLFAVMLLCLLSGCVEKQTSAPPITAPSRDTTPILPPATQSTVNPVKATPVYATAFGDTVVLSTVPVQEWDAQKPDCTSREISNGGRILCGGEHEKETPITKAVILEDIIPKVTAGWFRDMVKLNSIRGLELLHTHMVTDMSYMFAGCESLSSLEIERWNVDKVTTMAGMFDGCDAMDTLPTWYDNE